MTSELHATLVGWLEHGTEAQRDHARRRLKVAKDSGEPITEPQSSPSVATQVVSAVKAAAQFVGSGFAMVSPEEQERRLAICKTCDRYEAVHGKCLACGCRVRIKTAMLLQRCPLGKWEHQG